MKQEILDKDIEFIGKKCFPLNEKSSQEFFMQVRRIAKKYGLKYREEEISRGMVGWIPRTVRPIIYRKILNPSEDRTDLSNYSLDDMVYFEDDHFFVKKGHEELRRELRDLYETFSMVRAVEEEVEKNKGKIEKIEQAEKKTRLEHPSLETQEISTIIDESYPLFKKAVEKESSHWRETPMLSWNYLDVKDNENCPSNDSLFKQFDSILRIIKNKIIDKFEERANAGVFEEFYRKWERENNRIIIPRKYR